MDVRCHSSVFIRQRKITQLERGQCASGREGAVQLPVKDTSSPQRLEEARERFCPGWGLLGECTAASVFVLALWPPGLQNHGRTHFQDFRPLLVVIFLFFSSSPSLPLFPFLLSFCLNSSLRKHNPELRTLASFGELSATSTRTCRYWGKAGVQELVTLFSQSPDSRSNRENWQNRVRVKYV